jgi:phosphohistidine swiveling domain-containing protein/DNA-binding transcriptional ArsR family regulator
MLEKLFSSKVMFSVLLELFRENKELSTRQLVELTKKKQPNIKKELDKLLAMGIVEMENKNNNNYYRPNKNYIYYSALEALFDGFLKSEKRFIVCNEEGGLSFLTLQYIIDGFAADYPVKDGILSFVPETFTVFKNNYGKFYMEEREVKQLSTESFEKLKEDPSFVFLKIRPMTTKSGEKILDIFRSLKAKDFKVDKQSAIQFLDEFKKAADVLCSYGMIAFLELRDNIYSNYLKNYLKDKTKDSIITMHYVLEKLLAPDELTFTQLLKIKLLNLALDKNQSEDKLNDLFKDWVWLNFGYRGPGLEYKYLAESLNELKTKPQKELKDELNHLLDYQDIVKREKKELFEKLKIDGKHQNYINALSALSCLKVYRKDILFLINYCTLNIIKSYKGDIPTKNLYYLTLEEAKELVSGKLKINLSQLEQRENECLHHSIGKKLLVGKEAKEFLDSHNIEKEDDSVGGSLRLLEGTTACLGETGNWVNGQVKIINSSDDIKKMNDGDVLVSVATTPDILMAMKKAAAIVTDQGGITCHAAIVSRELKKPCLIGTKYATKIFKDGDKVVVCPRHGYIKFQ